MRYPPFLLFLLSAAMAGGTAVTHATQHVPLQPTDTLAANVSVVDDNAPDCGSGADDCLRVEVRCPNVQEPISAVLRWRRPTGVIEGGYVLFFNGSSGTRFWGDAATVAGDTIERLNADGFHTIEIRWDSSWLKSAPNVKEGPAALACRPASVAHWFHVNHVAATPAAAFCATGNSAGAAQVAYMLTHYGMDNLLDLAVLTSGPPLGRIDLGCTHVAGDALRYAPGSAGFVDQAFGGSATALCTAGRNGTLSDADREVLRQASVAWGGDYDYPRSLTMAFLFGGEDSGASPALGLTYAGAIIRSSGPGSLDNPTVMTLPGVGHTLHKTADGTAAIYNAIGNRCRKH